MKKVYESLIRDVENRIKWAGTSRTRLQITSYHRKEIFRENILLRAVEKELHLLRQNLRNKHSLREEWVTDSWLMRKIHILNEEANHRNQRIYSYKLQIRQIKESTSPQVEIDVLNAELARYKQLLKECEDAKVQ